MTLTPVRCIFSQLPSSPSLYQPICQSFLSLRNSSCHWDPEEEEYKLLDQFYTGFPYVQLPTFLDGARSVFRCEHRV